MGANNNKGGEFVKKADNPVVIVTHRGVGKGSALGISMVPAQL